MKVGCGALDECEQSAALQCGGAVIADSSALAPEAEPLLYPDASDGGVTCDICDQAKTCCEAEAALTGASEGGDCAGYSMHNCLGYVGTQLGEYLAECQDLLDEGAELCLPACL